MEIDFEKIKQLRKEINRLLEQKPELIPFQKQIDAELAKAGNNRHNRMAILENMMREKLKEMTNSLRDLQRSVLDLADGAKEALEELKDKK